MQELTPSPREALLEKARLLPLCPGVYLMQDKAGRVIYVGKSKALKNRVSSYFQATGRHNLKTQKLVGQIFDFSCIYTKTEAESLILENELIKLYQPKYNIKLKDDKNYPYIRLSAGEAFPRLTTVRKRLKNTKDKYFGPYSSQTAANTVLDAANLLFSLPVCRRQFPQDIGKQRPCLYYHMGRCVGVCTGQVDPQDYARRLEQVSLFLKEDHKSVALLLQKEMQEASQRLEFERAASLRDRLRSLDKVGQKQQIVRDPAFEADVFGVFEDATGSCVCRLVIRGGRLIDSHLYTFQADEILHAEAFTAMVPHLYTDGRNVPKLLLLEKSLLDREDTASWAYLEEQAGHRVQVSVPEKGDRKRLVELACQNAREATVHRRAVLDKNTAVLEELARILSLPQPPERIEAIDISNSGDQHLTAGIICLENARFAKKDYKLFNLQLTHRDDVGSMQEAYRRRFARYQQQDAGFSRLPDLILVDGGVAQVHAVRAVVEEFGQDVPVYGMVKDSFHKTRCLTDGNMDISIAKNQTLFRFIYRIQEEVHRFAFSRMDTKRRKSVKSSSLEQIPGIGPQKAKNLLSHFRTLKQISAASPEELVQVKGLSQADARQVYLHFHPQG